MNKIKIIGVVMKYEYEAVSGNQEIFKHDKLGNSHTASVSNEGELHFWRTNLKVFGDIIAERKVTEKYIPKAGDFFRIAGKALEHGECLCLKSNDCGVAFEYLDDEIGHFDSISTSVSFKFIRNSDDKAANPVNFTSEKYVPRVGDQFVARDLESNYNTGVILCEKVSSSQVIGKTIHKTTLTIDLSESCEFILIHRPSTK